MLPPTGSALKRDLGCGKATRNWTGVHRLQTGAGWCQSEVAEMWPENRKLRPGDTYQKDPQHHQHRCPYHCQRMLWNPVQGPAGRRDAQVGKPCRLPRVSVTVRFECTKTDRLSDSRGEIVTCRQAVPDEGV